MKILLVDGFATVRSSLAATLEAAGLDVLRCPSIAAARPLLADDAVDVDLVMLDIAQARASIIEEPGRKTQELEALTYSVSHDLRAPLRGIDGFSAALQEDFGEELAPEAQEFLDRIRSSAARMNELIQDLVELSRVGRGELQRERVEIDRVAQRVVDDLAKRDPDRVVTVACEPGLVVVGDRHLLGRLLENLIDNAWKFTSTTTDARIELGSVERSDGMAIYVKDNGVGFDPEFAAGLFRPFQRLHRESEFPGTGIGLAIVYRIVDRHGGRVWADSALGVGTTIYFTLARKA